MEKIDVNKIEYIKTIDGRVFMNDGVEGEGLEYKEGVFYYKKSTLSGGKKYTEREIIPFSGVQRIAYYETVTEI